MLIATFGPSTAWVGKTITFNGRDLVLEGHGPVTAAQVLVYESQGHLTWSSEQSAEMVRTMAVAAAPATAAPGGGASEWKETKRWLGTPKQLIIAAVLIVFLIATCVVVAQMVKDEELPAVVIPAAVDDAQDSAREEAVYWGVRSIQVGLQSWAVDHLDAYPDASVVNEVDLAEYVDIWPTNPYTDLPMDQGTGPGQFTYQTNGDYEFSITAYGVDGAAIITVP